VQQPDVVGNLQWGKVFVGQLKVADPGVLRALLQVQEDAADQVHVALHGGILPGLV
jgi:hypothetical protein